MDFQKQLFTVIVTRSLVSLAAEKIDQWVRSEHTPDLSLAIQRAQGRARKFTIFRRIEFLKNGHLVPPPVWKPFHIYMGLLTASFESM